MLTFFLCLCFDRLISPEYLANTPELRQSLHELRTHVGEALEAAATKICSTGDTRSILLVIGCLNSKDFLRKLGYLNTEEIPSRYYPLQIASCRIIDAIAGSKSPWREEFLLLLYYGPYRTYKFDGPLRRWHSERSEPGILLAFRHIKNPSPKVLALLKNNHLSDPQCLNDAGNVIPWNSTHWDVINTALSEMQSARSIELLADRLIAYAARPSIPKDLYRRQVGDLLVGYRNRIQNIALLENILAKKKDDSALVHFLLRRVYQLTAPADSSCVAGFSGPAPAWSDMDLSLLVAHAQFIWRYHQHYQKMQCDSEVVFAFAEIAKLIVTRSTYKLLLPQVLALLDDQEFSKRQNATLALRIMSLFDPKECMKFLKAQRLSSEMQRRLADFVRAEEK